MIGILGNPQKVRKAQVVRFLGKYIEDPKSKLALDDLFAEYKDYILSNAQGYDFTLTEFKKEIADRFPNSTVASGTVTGIAKRVKVKAIEAIRDPFNELMINNVHNLLYSSVDARQHFSLERLVTYSGQDAEKVAEWIQKSPFVYYNPHKNRYHFGQYY